MPYSDYHRKLEHNKRYRRAHKEYFARALKRWRAANKGKVKAYNAKYRKMHKR